MQRNIENNGQSHIDHKDFEVLSRYGMVGEGEIPGIGEIEKVIITDANGNRKEISARPQVMYSGIGRSRKAITVFIPDREVLEELKKS